ncbi:hypothetical protein NM688_g3423 [Phlebia brevispora]|uniref:Uncharacterized protein n=1 Tax=Phlebia brevispora TaxID=194682 RepID=A0ACC1T5X5_9APHY|nr:hypothetical protein NM688_g3423 [Phlebia brevispora]
MSLPFVEIVKLVVTDAFRADLTLLNPTVELMSQAKGILGIYAGFELQDSQYLYIAVVWQSMQHQLDALADEGVRKKFGETFSAVEASRIFQHRVTFSAEPFTALSAPVTEFATWTVKETKDREQFKVQLQRLSDTIVSYPSSIGIHKGGWGTVVEDEKEMMILMGWDSLEIFQKASSEARELVPLLDEMKKLADLEIKNAALKKYFSPSTDARAGAHEEWLRISNLTAGRGQPALTQDALLPSSATERTFTLIDDTSALRVSLALTTRAVNCRSSRRSHGYDLFDVGRSMQTTAAARILHPATHRREPQVSLPSHYILPLSLIRTIIIGSSHGSRKFVAKENTGIAAFPEDTPIQLMISRPRSTTVTHPQRSYSIRHFFLPTDDIHDIIEEANLVGLFMETLFYGILIVSSGYCLRLLLCRTGRLTLKPAQEIRWWAVVVVVLMTAISTLDLALNLRLNLRAFIWSGGSNESVIAVFGDTMNWANITRRLLLPFVVLVLVVTGGVLAAVIVTVLGTARDNIDAQTSTIITVVCFANDILFNAVATTLIVRKLWKTRSTSADADKWLTIIRIIVESGLLYIFSVLILVISTPVANLGNCVGDVVGQIIAIASILIMIRTHDVFQTRSSPSGPSAMMSTPVFAPRSNVFSAAIPLSTIGSGPETHVDLAASDVTQPNAQDEKAPMEDNSSASL